jgi:hypothetical protein
MSGSASSRGQIVRQEFQGDDAAQVSILSPVDDTHPASAKLLNDAVVRNGLADHAYVT